MKRVWSALIVLVCMIVLCVRAVGWTDIRFASDADKETARTENSSGMGKGGIEGRWMVPMRQEEREPLEEGDIRYSMQFAAAGTEYTVTLETVFQNSQEELSEFMVCLWNGEEAIQSFSCLLLREKNKKWWCEDLNFDGFPDLVLCYSSHKNNMDYCSVYLWDEEYGKFSGSDISIPSEYVRHEEEQVLTADFRRREEMERVMYRLEGGEVSVLGYQKVNYREGTQIIGKRESNEILYEGKLQEVDEEEGEEILWGSLSNGEKGIRNYWTVETEDYKVSLQDLIPNQSLQLVIDKDGEEKIVRVYRKDMDYESPSGYHAEAFDHLLGHSGFSLLDESSGWFNRRFYYAMDEDELVLLAMSFRPSFAEDSRLDYMVDIDGDGDRELVCEVMYGGDGAACTEIYHYDGQQVLVGSGDSLLEAEDWYDWGTNSSWSEYLPEENVIRIHYSRRDDESGFKDYELDLKRLGMERAEETYE